MSCGNPHEVDCTKVAELVTSVLDGEADDATCAMVLQHLHECGPCDEDAGAERSIKALVARACGCEPVPTQVRERVMWRIQQVQVDAEGVTSVTVEGDVELR